MWLGGRMRRRVSGGLGPAPTLSAFKLTARPTYGAAQTTGGDVMTITGANLDGSIEIATTPTPTVVATTGTSTSRTCTLPALLQGVYTVRAKNLDGQYSATQPLIVVAPLSTYGLAHLAEQRGGGDANDYNPATGAWPARAGANIWNQPTAGSRPGTLTSIDGAAPVEVHATGKALLLAETMATLGTADEVLFFFVGKIPSGLVLGSGWTDSDPTFFGDAINQQYWQIAAGTLAGTTYVKAGFYQGGPVSAKKAATADAVHFVVVRHFAGALAVGVDGAPGSTVNGADVVTCAAQTNPIFNITTAPTAGATPGLGLLALGAKQSLTDAQLTGVGGIYDYFRFYRYPSAGLP